VLSTTGHLLFSADRPERSWATALGINSPSGRLVVSRLTSYGAEVSSPTFLAQVKNSTREIWSLSTALAYRVVVPET